MSTRSRRHSESSLGSSKRKLSWSRLVELSEHNILTPHTAVGNEGTRQPAITVVLPTVEDAACVSHVEVRLCSTSRHEGSNDLLPPETRVLSSIALEGPDRWGVQRQPFARSSISTVPDDEDLDPGRVTSEDSERDARTWRTAFPLATETLPLYLSSSALPETLEVQVRVRREAHAWSAEEPWRPSEVRAGGSDANVLVGKQRIRDLAQGGALPGEARAPSTQGLDETDLGDRPYQRLQTTPEVDVLESDGEQRFVDETLPMVVVELSPENEGVAAATRARNDAHASGEAASIGVELSLCRFRQARSVQVTEAAEGGLGTAPSATGAVRSVQLRKQLAFRDFRRCIFSTIVQAIEVEYQKQPSPAAIAAAAQWSSGGSFRLGASGRAGARLTLGSSVAKHVIMPSEPHSPTSPRSPGRGELRGGPRAERADSRRVTLGKVPRPVALQRMGTGMGTAAGSRTFHHESSGRFRRNTIVMHQVAGRARQPKTVLLRHALQAKRGSVASGRANSGAEAGHSEKERDVHKDGAESSGAGGGGVEKRLSQSHNLLDRLKSQFARNRSIRRGFWDYLLDAEEEEEEVEAGEEGNGGDEEGGEAEDGRADGIWSSLPVAQAVINLAQIKRLAKRMHARLPAQLERDLYDEFFEDIRMASPDELSERDDSGFTPVMISAMYGETRCLKDLLRKGADATRMDEDGHNALTYAVLEGNYECAELLLRLQNGHPSLSRDKGPPPRRLGERFLTTQHDAAKDCLLHVACRQGHTRIARKLLLAVEMQPYSDPRMHANADHVDENGRSGLIFAVENEACTSVPPLNDGL